MRSFISRTFATMRLPKYRRGQIFKSKKSLGKPTYAEIAEKLILDELKVIYIVIPKTGCTSVKKFFSNYYGWREIDNVHNPLSDIYKHISNDDIRQKIYDNHFVFTFVRNPFSRLYSTYKEKVRAPKKPPNWIDGVAPGIHKMGVRKTHNFSEFVEIVCSTPDELCDPHVKPQWQFVVANDGELVVDKWLKFENFQLEFSRLIISLGINTSVNKIPHKNKSRSIPMEYVSQYNQRLIDIVQKKYQLDFEIFDYTNNGI